MRQGNPSPRPLVMPWNPNVQEQCSEQEHRLKTNPPASKKMIRTPLSGLKTLPPSWPNADPSGLMKLQRLDPLEPEVFHAFPGGGVGHGGLWQVAALNKQWASGTS